jgi:hypothetical protein
MKTIKIVPYGCLLHVTDNFSEWNRYYARLSGNEPMRRADGYTFDNLDGNYYVGIFNNNLNVVAHELAHVCLMVAGRVQLGNIIEEQEQFCYLIGHLTGEVLKLFPKFKGDI